MKKLASKIMWMVLLLQVCVAFWLIISSHLWAILTFILFIFLGFYVYKKWKRIFRSLRVQAIQATIKAPWFWVETVSGTVLMIVIVSCAHTLLNMKECNTFDEAPFIFWFWMLVCSVCWLGVTSLLKNTLKGIWK
ncbi:MAG: hypothetical protein WCI00_01250 [bacterium]